MASGDERHAWQVAPAEPERARALAAAVQVRPLTAQLLLNRKIDDPARAQRFLDPRLGDLRAPEGAGAAWAMAGFGRAADRLTRVVLDGETIGVFGDYDVDGLTTCALLSRFLGDAGAKVVPRVARRESGYGFGKADAEAFQDAGCRVVITGDCGTSDFEAIAAANALGMDTVIVDHHQVPDRDPGAYALINPHQTSCSFPFKGLASVGVGFYLAAAIRTLLRTRQPSVEVPDPRALLDLVAVGTVADLAPLTDENRVLVSAGLRELRRGRRPGLRALAEIGGVPFDRPLTAADVGFSLGPRLNAPGRLGDAGRTLELLLADDVDAARGLAAACEEANRRRRVLQDKAYAEALEQVENLPAAERAVTIVAGDGWAPGVVGIVAAKLVDRYGVPAVVIAFEGDEGRGSARSVRGVDLYKALEKCAGHLVRFGGHAAAAGLTVRRGELEAFRRMFADLVRGELSPAADRQALPVDAEVELGELDEHLADELGRLGPFGVGNPEPLLGVRSVEVARARVVGERHLQLVLREGRQTRDGIAFGLGARNPGPGARLRVALVPEIDTFRGNRRLRLRVRDFALEGAAPREAP